MKFKMKAVMCGVLLALAVQHGMAAPNPVEGAALLTDSMQALLSLDEAQTAKVKQFNLAHLQRGKEIKDGGGRKLLKLRQIAALRADRERDLKSVLTSAQFATFQTHRSEMLEQALDTGSR